MIDRVRRFFQDLDRIDSSFIATGYAECPFQRTPSEFLEFADADLKQPNPQASANALANAKRALDCQLDYFMTSFGLGKLAGNWSTAKKIGLMDDLGVVPGSILYRVNKARNDLEHRYEVPSIVTAENSVDIVGLFIAASDMYLCSKTYDIRFEMGLDQDHSEGVKGLFSEPESFVEVGLKEEIIGVAGKHDGISFDIDVRADSNINDYLFLLTLLLHGHRINMPGSIKFFKKLKYFKTE